jgi:hypothetical protein
MGWLRELLPAWRWHAGRDRARGVPPGMTGSVSDRLSRRSLKTEQCIGADARAAPPGPATSPRPLRWAPVSARRADAERLRHATDVIEPAFLTPLLQRTRKPRPRNEAV